jgi:hypothetical protein
MSIRPPGSATVSVLADGEPGPSFTAIVESAARAAAGMVGNAADWWTVPSTSLLQEGVLSAQNALRPLLLVVLTGSVLVQAVRIGVSRKGEPVIAVAGGLMRSCWPPRWASPCCRAPCSPAMRWPPRWWVTRPATSARSCARP